MFKTCKNNCVFIKCPILLVKRMEKYTLTSKSIFYHSLIIKLFYKMYKLDSQRIEKYSLTSEQRFVKLAQVTMYGIKNNVSLPKNWVLESNSIIFHFHFYCSLKDRQTDMAKMQNKLGPYFTKKKKFVCLAFLLQRLFSADSGVFIG